MKENLHNKPDFENHLHETEKRWFAVYTRYKSEKVVAQFLHNKQIEHYLPLQKVVRRYARKIKTHYLPLINCYVFVHIVKDEYVPVLETEHVVKFLKISKNLISIPDHEIETMRRVVGDGENVKAEPGLLNEGDRVEIIAGKLTGIRGRLLDKHGKKQMVVELESLGYSLKINVDVQFLRKL